MENNYLQENIKYNFLSEPEAKEIFADIDFALKSGIHIQKQSKPEAMFGFLRTNYHSLKVYYADFFDFYLRNEGQGDEQYFFIDFRKENNGTYNRGKLPINKREYLKDGFIVIGFLLIRMYILEPNFEYRHSIKGFKIKLLQDYDEYKAHLLRLFAGSEDTDSTDYETNTIESTIDAALKKFDNLGWVFLDTENGNFEILPSFKRLLLVYEDTILNIDQIIKQYKIEE